MINDQKPHMITALDLSWQLTNENSACTLRSKDEFSSTDTDNCVGSWC